VGLAAVGLVVRGGLAEGLALAGCVAGEALAAGAGLAEVGVTGALSKPRGSAGAVVATMGGTPLITGMPGPVPAFDPHVRSAMAADLTERGHAVRTAGTALDGIREVTRHRPEVIILDLGLPDLDGGQALKMIRAITATPVLVATARDEEAEIIRLLNAGADDYVVKPFSGEHLAARITALLRRSAPPGGAAVLSVARLSVDLGRREAQLDGQRLELTRREFDLLAYLTARPGEVVTRRELRTEVWHQSYGDDQTIDVHISWLRRKLGETAAAPRYLHTVRGVGVGNVFRHTPEGTEFAVTLHCGDGVVLIFVADAGPGIGDLAAVLRRGGSGAGSTGLGLDIVRRVAESTGGDLKVDSSSGLGGAQVQLWLRTGPLAGAGSGGMRNGGRKSGGRKSGAGSGTGSRHRLIRR
jgi:DNA-binding response OmpR family regulator